jgi:tetratricopeptide (TPR) repeat protein
LLSIIVILASSCTTPGPPSSASRSGGSAMTSTPAHASDHDAPGGMEAQDGIERTAHRLAEASACPDGPRRRRLLLDVEEEAAALVEGAYATTPQAWLHLGVSRHLLAAMDRSETKLNEALAALEQCCALDPDFQYGVYWLALTAEAGGSMSWSTDKARARSWYERFRDAASKLTNPAHRGLYWRASVKYADTCWHLGERDLARTIYDEVHHWAMQTDAPDRESASAMLALAAASLVVANGEPEQNDLAAVRQMCDRARTLSLKAEAGLGEVMGADLGRMMRLNAARSLALIALAEGRPDEGADALGAITSLMDDPAISRMAPPEVRRFLRAEHRDMSLAAKAMFGANLMDHAEDAEVFDAVRRLGLGLLASDLGAGARLACPLLCRVQEMQSIRDRGPFRQAPEASVRAIFELALAEEATGRVQAALGRYTVLADVASEAMGEAPARQEWAAIRSAAEEARERIRLDKPDPQAVRRAAAAAMDRAIEHHQPGEPADSGTRAGMSARNPEQPAWGAEVEARIRSDRERWNQYRIWYRHGDRVFFLGITH